jgi:hypothetical protein
MMHAMAEGEAMLLGKGGFGIGAVMTGVDMPSRSQRRQA